VTIIYCEKIFYDYFNIVIFLFYDNATASRAVHALQVIIPSVAEKVLTRSSSQLIGADS
jgi:hypothetical protein